ncbi:hypothetical protein BS47DRAFT_1367118 [Hydnum rufescens UP504]|uniref:Uncharacterized protein n=1 Tax=Hydnum rufescens UP504 TaxID=1448309 RepID=A0A9P6AK33_9AGAM|nr:hypothetical protein BS47DRAFT_1367118 [Hydnum rufescens UP504]
MNKSATHTNESTSKSTACMHESTTSTPPTVATSSPAPLSSTTKNTKKQKSAAVDKPRKSIKSTADDKLLTLSNSVTCADKPEWFTTIMKWFIDLPLQGSWKDLLDSWVAFEKIEGYRATSASKKKGLTSKYCPAAVAEWMKYHCQVPWKAKTLDMEVYMKD